MTNDLTKMGNDRIFATVIKQGELSWLLQIDLGDETDEQEYAKEEDAQIAAKWWNEQLNKLVNRADSDGWVSVETANAAKHALECVWSGVTDVRRKGLGNSLTPDETVVMIPVLWGTLRKVRDAINALSDKPQPPKKG